jgi:hypothetical protein
LVAAAALVALFLPLLLVAAVEPELVDQAV